MPGRTPIGYAEPRVVSAGETIAFMVHAEEPFDAAVVELQDGPAAGRGPHLHRELDHEVTGRYDAVRQTTPLGSLVSIEAAEGLTPAQGLTFTCWLWATMPSRGRQQGIFGCGATQERLALSLDPEGRIVLGRWRDDRVDVIAASGRAVPERLWIHVGFTLDPAGGRTNVWWRSGDNRLGAEGRGGADAASAVELSGHPMTLAATDVHSKRPHHGRFTLNGKLEAPCLWTRRLSAEELNQLADGMEPSRLPLALAGCWRFSSDLHGSRLHDEGPLALHGTACQAPARAVTGRRWTGEEHDPRLERSHYDAIHFHEDDLEDAAWDPTLSIVIPQTWRSGIYGLRLEAGGTAFHIPFVVRPDLDERPGEGHGGEDRVLFLLHTLTYLAYANSRNEVALAKSEGSFGAIEALVEHYSKDHLPPSLYDSHADESPVYFATSRKPIIELQPDLASWATKRPRHFSLDLGIYGWLRRSGATTDVITDEVLDQFGYDALRSYSVVVTGCHPEYTTPRMNAALERYIAEGGRLMYPGGNGLYWAVSQSDSCPWLTELRRGQGGSGGAPDGAIGENHEATTGRLGGLWRYRGHPAQEILGVGTSAVGWRTAAPYRVTGRGPSWLRSSLAAAADDEGLIGKATSGTFGGAAGDEIDRADVGLGTPANAEVVATSAGLHTPDYEFPKEDFKAVPVSLDQSGLNPDRRDALLRADLTYYENDQGGAVFAAGSLAWSLGLLRDVEDRSVHEITSAVLSRFLEQPSAERHASTPRADPSDRSGVAE